MKCRYCARTLRVIPLSPVEIEPHCRRRGCCWCAECFRGETPVSPARNTGAGRPSGAAGDYRPRHGRPAPGPGSVDPWAA